MTARIIQLTVIYGLLLISTEAFAAETHGLSQWRDPLKSYSFYINSHRSTQLSSESNILPGSQSAFESAAPVKDINFENIQTWESSAELETAFANMRDIRFIEDTKNNNFKRRSSWLFPDDGCFARAELAIIHLSDWNHHAPNKIFVFGDLNVKTPNSPSGVVTWWYHVAPIIKVGNESYVLDPSLENKHPLRVKEWLAMTSPDLDNLSVAICSSTAYDPDSSCDQTSSQKDVALADQGSFLGSEWNRQLELGRDPAQVLGDAPPWAK